MTPRPLLLALAVVLVAAWGQVASGAAEPSPDDPVSAPAQHDSGEGSRPELREPEEGLAGVRARPFERHRAWKKNVTVFYWSGVDECYGLDHIDVRERRRKVILTVHEGHHPEAGACPDVAVEVRSIARLRKPLGTRRVVDGAE